MSRLDIRAYKRYILIKLAPQFDEDTAVEVFSRLDGLKYRKPNDVLITLILTFPKIDFKPSRPGFQPIRSRDLIDVLQEPILAAQSKQLKELAAEVLLSGGVEKTQACLGSLPDELTAGEVGDYLYQIGGVVHSCKFWKFAAEQGDLAAENSLNQTEKKAKLDYEMLQQIRKTITARRKLAARIEIEFKFDQSNASAWCNKHKGKILLCSDTDNQWHIHGIKAPVEKKNFDIVLANCGEDREALKEAAVTFLCDEFSFEFKTSQMTRLTLGFMHWQQPADLWCQVWTLDTTLRFSV